MTEEIKPCPFCGNKVGIGEVELVKNMKTASTLDRNLFKVTCWQCGAESGARDSEEYAVWQWNQRPYDFDMPAIVKKVERLEDDLQEALFALKAWCFMFPLAVSKLDKDILEKHNLVEAQECKQPE